jgi:formylglycine-generating enzyme
MKKHIALLAAAFLAASTAATANIVIDTVLIGNANNANDSTGYGGVGYNYHIGTYEVTNNQYTAFLNATAATDTHSLYNTDMNNNTHGGITRSGSSGSYTYSVKSGFGNKPVNYVSFWDAARFSNWLTTGGTETGVYNLNGTTAPTNNTITRDATAFNNGGVAVASENEWYKAAYYDPTLNSGSGGYWLYPTQSNSITTTDANFDMSVGTVTDVGTYAADPSFYGTFDQGGNAWERNDEILSTSDRGLRGGEFGSGHNALQSSNVSTLDPTVEFGALGFRVSSLAPIPEPSAYAAILGCLGLSLALVRRKGRA